MPWVVGYELYLVSEPHTRVRSLASPCMSSTRYNPYPTPAYLITNIKHYLCFSRFFTHIHLYHFLNGYDYDITAYSTCQARLKYACCFSSQESMCASTKDTSFYYRYFIQKQIVAHRPNYERIYIFQY